MGDGSLSQEEINALLMDQDEPFIRLKKLEKPMTDILSQDEIDQLLSAISSGDSKEDWSDHWSSSDFKKKVKIYDFKRPDTFSKQQIRIILNIAETYSRLMSVSLLSKLKTEVNMYVSSVCQLSFEEFLRSIPNPCLISIVDADPLKGSLFVEIDPSISNLFIDLSCGGHGKKYESKRAHSDAEISILEGFIVHMLGNMREAWSKILDLRPRLSFVESDPSLCKILHPLEMGVLLTLEIRLCEEESFINIFFPESTLREIKDKLTYETYFRAEESDRDFSPFIGQLSHNCLVKYKDEPLILNSELSLLKKGDFIPLNSKEIEIVL